MKLHLECLDIFGLRKTNCDKNSNNKFSVQRICNADDDDDCTVYINVKKCKCSVSYTNSCYLFHAVDILLGGTYEILELFQCIT